VKQAPIVLLGISIGINAILIKQLRERPPVPARVQLAPGTQIIPVEATTLDGKRTVIGYGGTKGTILYYFSPSCIWCQRNWDNLRAMQAAVGDRFRVIGLSNAPRTAQYVREQGLPFDTFTNVSATFLKKYQLTETPRTLVVSTEGRVLRDWSGAYVGRTQQEVEAFFSIKLPGTNERWVAAAR
jgi:hypothetical protein